MYLKCNEATTRQPDMMTTAKFHDDQIVYYNVDFINKITHSFVLNVTLIKTNRKTNVICEHKYSMYKLHARLVLSGLSILWCDYMVKGKLKFDLDYGW